MRGLGSLPCSRILRTTSMPLPSLSRMSVTTMSGRVRAIASIASRSPSAKPTTSKLPSASTLSMILRRISEESSTTNTRTESFILVHQLMAQGVSGEIGVAGEAHLLEDAAAISADRLDRETHLVGDVGHRFAGRELHENLKLAVRQLPVQWRRGIAGRRKRQRFRERCANVFAARRNHANRLEQVTRLAGLREEAARAGAQQVDRVLLLGMHADD